MTYGTHVRRNASQSAVFGFRAPSMVLNGTYVNQQNRVNNELVHMINCMQRK
jgi:hypothetical protein